MKVKELVASWGRGPNGNGEIALAHFRKQVRSIIEEQEVNVIDEMFLSSTKGGSILVHKPELLPVRGYSRLTACPVPRPYCASDLVCS